LQARNPRDSQTFQLIPRPVLSGDFPRHFVDEYIHWLDLSTGELEFRPATSPWISGSSNWRLHIRRPGVLEKIRKPGILPRALLQKPSQDNSPIQVIDIRSSTFAVVSGLLSPLESPEYIIATHTVQSLEVSLRRLHLSFFVNKNWELECRTIPGYVVDATQSCGTLFGLRNKLILCPRPSGSEEPLLPRRVIIPEGEVSFSTDGDFANVSIKTDAGEHVRWHEYTINTNLGCLTSNSSLSSKLYQCYLHALTSHCLPDPLLGHTGTEEALYILRSAGCRSFQRLAFHEERLLKLISGLSPERVFDLWTTSNMKWNDLWTTSNVKWNDLPALSQHHDFFLAVRSILYHAHALEGLYDQPRAAGFDDRYFNQLLLNRVASRNGSYYPSGLHMSGQLPSPSDVEYRSLARAAHDDRDGEYVAYRTSWSIWNARFSVNEDLWNVMDSWDSLGPAGSGISLRYSRYWLEFHPAKDWFVIYDLFRKAANRRNPRNMRIELSFSLSAAAYSRVDYSNVTNFLVAFALDERFRSLSPPPEHSFTLWHGLAPTRKNLEDIILGSVRSTSISLINGESLAAIVDSILNQWPDYKSVDSSEQWFNRSQCNRRIKEYFQSLSRNIRLREHVLQLQSILENYQNIPIPAALPYVFYPQFVTSHSKAPSYSLHDILSSRTNVPTPSACGEPFQYCAVPATDAKIGAPPQAGLGGLEILIEELRHSPKPLLQQYGNELNNSHRELLGQTASQSAGNAVPPHEALVHYYNECTHKKDKLFSEISAALVPARDVEETIRIAGLWPSIIPRSILRHLAQDRISTLPERWKFVITCYAVSFLKYQQSLRLVELSSRQQHEELLREMDTIRHDILAESSPDWLLVQVRPLLC
jgi:hypothetical protein